MSYVWRYGGDWGGGYMNVGCWDPQTPGQGVMCSDTWGLRLTKNYGNDWVGANWGGTGIAMVYGRACAFSKDPSDVGTCYTGFGTQKSATVSGNPGGNSGGGGFGKITPDGKVTIINAFRSWKTGYASGAGSFAPRPMNDNLIICDWDGTTHRIYIADNTGVARSTNKGVSWTNLGVNAPIISGTIPGGFRAMALIDANTLIVASKGGDGFTSAVHTITAIQGGAPQAHTVTLPAGVTQVNDFCPLSGGVVLAACGAQGVYRVTNAGQTWAKISGTFFDGLNITCLRQAANGRLFAAIFNSSSAAKNIARSTGAWDGSTWQWCTISQGNTPTSTFDTHNWPAVAGEQDWWLAFTQSLASTIFGPSVMGPDPWDPNRITIFGRRGAFQTRDGGDHWKPCTRGGNGGMTHHVWTDTNGDILADDIDWVGKRSPDEGFTVVHEPSPGAPPASSLSKTMHGHSISVTAPASATAPASVQIDGADQTNNFFRAACMIPNDVLILADGTAIVGLFGGLLIGRDSSAAPFNPPEVFAATPLPVSATGASLRGAVNPNNLATSYHFDWGPTTAYGNSTPTRNLPSDVQPAYVTPEPISGLTNGQTYFFRLVATNSQGTATPSTGSFVAGGTSTAPAAPTLAGNVISTTENDLTWNTPSGAVTFNLYQNGVLYQQGLSSPSFNDTGLTPSTTYNYTVTAVNSGNVESNQSNIVSLTTQTPTQTLGTPTLTATPVSSTEIDLSWTSVASATSYELQRDGVTIATQSGTTFNDTGLGPSETHVYQVRAHGAGGVVGAYSTPQSATTSGVTTAQPFVEILGFRFTFRADPGNSGVVYIGDGTVTGTGGGNIFTQLVPGETVTTWIPDSSQMFWAPAVAGDLADVVEAA